jgi:hypothetical protein
MHISFTEVVIMVTATSLICTKKDLSIAAKFFGNSIGRIVGTLQGGRTRYERSVVGNDVFQISKSVRDGIQEINSISTDIAMIRYKNFAPSQILDNKNNLPELSSLSSLYDSKLISKQHTTTNNNVKQIPNNISEQTKDFNSKLTRLILAEDHFNKANNQQSNTGADIIMQAVSDSIIADHMHKKD